MSDDCLERAAYIIKCTDEHFLNLHEAIKKDDEEMRKKIINSPKVLQYFREHPEYNPDSLNEYSCGCNRKRRTWTVHLN